MFFDTFSNLCRENGVTPNKALVDCEISRTSVVKWKKGAVPNGSTLAKLADYFGVSTDYLLTGKQNEKAPTPEGEREITFDDFTYAMHNETKDLPEEKKKMLLDMARFMKADLEKNGNR